MASSSSAAAGASSSAGFSFSFPEGSDDESKRRGKKIAKNLSPPCPWTSKKGKRSKQKKNARASGSQNNQNQRRVTNPRNDEVHTNVAPAVNPPQAPQPDGQGQQNAALSQLERDCVAALLDLYIENLFDGDECDSEDLEGAMLLSTMSALSSPSEGNSDGGSLGGLAAGVEPEQQTDVELSGPSE